MRKLEAVYKGGLNIEVLCYAPYLGYYPVDGLFKAGSEPRPYKRVVEAFDRALSKRKRQLLADNVKNLMLEAERQEQESELDIRKCETT